MTNRIGFDVSFYQERIDFPRMKAWGAEFVIIKAGQGSWADPRFDENWAGAKAAGIPRASYWYYDNRYAPKDQARKYVDIVRHDPAGMCWLDLEDKNAGVYGAWQSWYDFIVEFQLLCNLPIGIYTGFYYFVDRLKFATTFQKSWFKQFPLWQAWYTPDPFSPAHESILVPFPWTDTRYLILQSGTPAIGHAAGVQSLEIDYDVFMGTDEQFANVFDVSDSGGEPQEEAIMYRYTATNLYPNMSLRSDHNTGSTVQRQFIAGTVWHGNTVWTAPEDKYLENGAQVNKAGDVWLQVELISGGAYSGWVAITHLGREYCKLVDSQPDPTPTPDPTFPAVIGVTIGNTTRNYVPE